MISLATIPSYVDIADSTFSADQPVKGSVLAQMAANAKFAMVRREVFQCTATDGQTIAAPASPIDGYQYADSEITWWWTRASSADQATGKTSGGGCIFSFTDAVSSAGVASITTNYYIDGGAESVTHDGELVVFLFCQRNAALHFGAVPTWSDVEDGDLGGGEALLASVLKQMNFNTRYAAVRKEFFVQTLYHGQTVTPPTSPVDGYTYAATELQYLPSMISSLPASGHTSGSGTLRQIGCVVGGMPAVTTPATAGQVQSTANYYVNGGAETLTNDGTILVLVIATREKGNPPIPPAVRTIPAPKPVTAFGTLAMPAGALIDGYPVKGVGDAQLLDLGAEVKDGVGGTYSRTKARYVVAGVPYALQGAWSSSAAYVVGDEVTYSGNYYLCTYANTNQNPAAIQAVWQLLGPGTADNLADGTDYRRSPAMTSAANIAPNPGFEASATLPPAGWTLGGYAIGGGVTLSWDTAAQCAGSRSLVLTVPAGGGYQGIGAPPFAVRPGDQFKLSAAVRWASGVTGAVQLIFIDAAGTNLGGYAVATGTSSTAWQSLTTSGAAPAGAVSAQIIIYSVNGGTVFAVDALYCVRIASLDDEVTDGSTYGRPLLARLSSGKPLIDFAEGIHLNQTLDHMGDGATYCRTTAAQRDGGGYAHLGLDATGAVQLAVPYSMHDANIRAVITGSGQLEYSSPITTAGLTLGVVHDRVANTIGGIVGTGLDNVTDGSTYGRPLLARLSSGKPLIDFAEGIHLNQTLDHMGDGATYCRTTAAQRDGGGYAHLGLDATGAVQLAVPYSMHDANIRAVITGSGQLEYSSPITTAGLTLGVVHDRVANTIGGIVGTGLDNVTDGSTYGRPLLARLSSGKPLIDFAEGIHLNQTLDHMGDGATYCRTTAAQRDGGGYAHLGLDATGAVQLAVPYSMHDANIRAVITGSGQLEYSSPITTAGLTLGVVHDRVANTIGGIVGTGLDNVTDGSTYGRPLLARLSSGKPLIDFAEGIHLNQTLDHMGDGATYCRTTAAQRDGGGYAHLGLDATGAVQLAVPYSMHDANIRAVITGSGQLEYSSPITTAGLTLGVVHDRVANTIGGIVGTGLDNVTDGSTYGRPLLARLSSGKPLIDFAEGIHLNQTLDHMGDGADYRRSAAYSSAANIAPNPGFEASATLPPAGWTLGGYAIGGGVTLSWDTAAQYAGSRSLVLTVPAGGGYQGIGAPPFAVRPGDQFKLSAAVRWASGVTGAVQLIFIDAAGTNLGGYAVATGTSSTAWQSLTTSGAAPAGAVSGQIIIYSVNGGTVFAVDALYCVRVASLDDEVYGQLATSGNLPNNSISNSTNTATVDSIDAGSSATARVYGVGGVGTAWTRYFGSATLTVPAATLTGLSYSTTYYVAYDPATSTYVVTTSFVSILPDSYLWAGEVTTVSAGGGGGSGGGGGTGGDGGGYLK